MEVEHCLFTGSAKKTATTGVCTPTIPVEAVAQAIVKIYTILMRVNLVAGTLLDSRDLAKTGNPRLDGKANLNRAGQLEGYHDTSRAWGAPIVSESLAV